MTYKDFINYSFLIKFRTKYCIIEIPFPQLFFSKKTNRAFHGHFIGFEVCLPIEPHLSTSGAYIRLDTVVSLFVYKLHCWFRKSPFTRDVAKTPM